MVLEKIKVINFRNYSFFEVDFTSNINIIYGDNGVGKTNLLESIYFLSITKSHRSFIDNCLIKENQNEASVTGITFDGLLHSTFNINIDNKKKILKINDKQIKKINEFSSNLKTIIFYPEDLELIKGSPIERRNYLNVQIGQLNKNYIKVVSEYEKMLKIRNDLIRKKSKNEKIDEIYFEIITNSLIEKAIIIYKFRKNYIDNINLNITNIYEDISDIKNFKIIYTPNINLNIYETEEIKKELTNKIKENLDKELKIGSTLYGPHKDDFIFNVGENNLKMYGSQGQQRMAVISLKLSEIPIFKEISGEYPILLLDDVFSELDINKRNNLLKYISDDIQTIITTTDINDIDKKIIERANLIKLS